MKSLSLLACLAVTVTASAAEPKDPARVASDFNQAVKQAREPAGPPRSLMEQSDALTITPLERLFSPDNLPAGRTPREPLHDAPRNPPPPVLPDNMPPGSIPWVFEGRVYWVVPLGPGIRR